PDMLFTDINIKDFDGIVFVGGKGASAYFDDPVAHKLAQDSLKENRILGAICIAPVILARAGVLKGKKATVWSSEAGQLRDKGADYTGQNVERDGKIITAAGPFAANEFGEELARALEV
ncbi:MAG: DJ-1/PfpI family protein, partial [Candidatus Omnitrophica bacterium]|nr:DJ-1/PfpI family protein [Candidatus Omnitrophota bacterium]